MDSRRRSVIGGGYLLSHFRSTIGVAGFNFSVRNGKRWNPRAVATLVRSGGPSVSPLRVSIGRLPPRGRRLGAGSRRRPPLWGGKGAWKRAATLRGFKLLSNRRQRRRASCRACRRRFQESAFAGALVFVFGGLSSPRKGFGLLVSLGCQRRRCCTCDLSTSSSSTALSGDLILGGASRLDAFSAYPGRTRLPGGAAGATTGAPVVRPTRSSRTSVGAPQISNAHNR